MTDEDDNDESSLALSGQVAKPQPFMVALADEVGSGSSILDLDLQDLCKSATAKLKIQWPEVQVEAMKSRYDGKKLPKVKWTGKERKPYREKHPETGSSVLDCEGMERHGFCSIPPVEPVVSPIQSGSVPIQLDREGEQGSCTGGLSPQCHFSRDGISGRAGVGDDGFT